MNNQLATLTELFNQNIFRIPDYQRGYAWGKKEYTEFWTDIIQMPIEHPYYMGVITIDAITNEKINNSTWEQDKWIIQTSGYHPYYVVDGQQRLTSLILLLEAILSNRNEKKQKYINFESITEIKNRFIVKFKGDSTRDYTVLFGYDRGNSSSKYFINKILKLPIVDNDNIQMTKYNHNLLDAETFFKTEIDKLNDNQIKNLYKKITARVVFNLYQISHDIDVFVTFETMNNRGKTLSTLELLKNRLIYLSTLFTGQQTSSQERIRNEVNTCWKKIYDYLGKNPNHMLADDDFLAAHTYFFFSKKNVDKNDPTELVFNKLDTRILLLNEIFTAQKVKTGKITVDYILKYIESLNDSIKFWYNVNFPQDRTVNTSLNTEERIYLMKLASLNKNIPFLNFTNISWKVLCMYYFSKVNDTQRQLSFLKELEKYLFLMIFRGYRNFGVYINSQINLKSISDCKDLDNYPSQIRKVRDKITDSDEFKVQLRQLFKEINVHGFYKVNRYFPTKYILEEYLVDCNKKAKQPLTFDQLVELYLGKTTLDHVFPQNVRGTNWNSFFKDFSSTQKTKIKNSLGNLVAMNSAKNEKIGNKNFKDKVTHGSVGYSTGYVDEQNIAKNEVWTIKEIKSRGYDIVNFINGRWGIKISSKTRNKFLGLEFISK